MRLVVDGFPFVARNSGIGTYTFELVRALARLAPEDEYYFSDCGTPVRDTRVPTGDPDGFAAHVDRVARHSSLWWRLTMPLPFPLRWHWRRRQVLRVRPDLYLGTCFFGLFHPSFRTVITIHDLNHLRYPQFTIPFMLRKLEKYLPDHARRADAVLADSESTRRDVIELLNVPPEKVHTVLLGLDERFRRVEDPDLLAEVRKRYRLPDRFLLHVGTIEPRKNLVCLLGAFERLAARPGFDHDLVLVGSTGWSNDEFFAALGRSPVRDRVRLAGRVDLAHLPAVYSLASAFVFPSVFEGFGLPPLEAMGCGVPVVASTSSSVPEVVGDAGLLADPGSPDEFADRVREVLGKPGLAADLSARGQARARTFTWEETARRTRGVFRSLGAAS